MQKIKKETKLTKEKEQAIEKIFGAKPVAKKVATKKIAKRVTTKNQEKAVKIVKKERIGSDGISRKERLSAPKNILRKNRFDFKKKIQQIPRYVFVILVVVFLIAVAFFVKEYRSKKLAMTQDATSVRNLQEVEKRIEVFMELPSDEQPVFATVTDIDKIKDQKFFSKAQNGDSVLIYTKNKKAILYRWSTNKLIEVSNVTGMDGNKGSSEDPSNSDDAAAQPQNDQAQNQIEASQTAADQDPSVVGEVKAKVIVLNGSKVAGLAKKMAESISSISGVEITGTRNAKAHYSKTLVVDLSGRNGDLAGKIAESVKGEAGQFPEGEDRPDADILVIASEN